MSKYVFHQFNVKSNLTFSVSGVGGALGKWTSSKVLSDALEESTRLGLDEITKKAKILYFDGAGEDATPVPLFVPPEPEEEEKGEVDEESKKKKPPRKTVMQTFLKVTKTLHD